MPCQYKVPFRSLGARDVDHPWPTAELSDPKGLLAHTRLACQDSEALIFTPANRYLVSDRPEEEEVEQRNWDLKSPDGGHAHMMRMSDSKGRQGRRHFSALHRGYHGKG